MAGLTGDELIGVMRAWQRLESWCASGVLTAIAELARRRPAGKTPAAPPGQFPAQISEFAVDEVAAALTLTNRAADRLYAVSLDLEVRLPVTARALHEGLIDRARAGLIAGMTRVLAAADARTIEALIFPNAGEQTAGQLRAALARAILARKLQHLIQARNPTCTARGCQRPATRCDLDHTNPYDHGGLTCECELAPLCRHHHRCKQAEGWRLEQPQPGVVIWTTPAGRHYTTQPDRYP